MQTAVFTWTCDHCGDQKERKSGGVPSGWRRIQLMDDMSVLLRADFCSVEHRDEWLKEHGLERKPAMEETNG